MGNISSDLQRRESPALRALGQVVRVLAGAGMAVAAACLLLSLCLIGWAVVMRYSFNAAPVWVDEVVGFLLGLVTEGNLEWPTWILMLLMPLGGALLLLAAIEACWRALAGLPALGKGGHGGGGDA